MFVHFNLEWITLLSGIVLVFYVLTKENLLKIFKITLAFYVWIIIVPFIDFIVYFPAGSSIDYSYKIENYTSCLLYFFNFTRDIGIPFGIRFEVLAGTVMAAVYVFLKTYSFFRSFLGALFVYLLAVSSMVYPVFSLLPFYPFTGNEFNSFIQNFYFSNGLIETFTGRISLTILFLLLFFLLIILRVYDKKFFRNLFSFPLPHMLLFPALFISGFFTGIAYMSYKISSPVFSNPSDYSALAGGIIISVLAFFNFKAPFRNFPSAAAENFRLIFIILLLITSAAYSFELFIIYLLFLALIFVLSCGIYNIENKPAVFILLKSFILFTVFLSGAAATAGQKTAWVVNLSAVIPVFITLFFYVFTQKIRSIKPDSVFFVSGLIGLLTGFTLFPALEKEPVFFGLSVLLGCAAVSVYFMRRREYAENLLAFILLFYFSAFAFFV
ncbi:MAG: hypothetical protein ACLFP1_03110 [Candidatus Goldiibacteriota bacterium]